MKPFAYRLSHIAYRRWKTKFSIICLFSIILLASPNSLHAAWPFRTAKINVKAQGFSLKDLGDKEVNLGDFEGKPVILFLWTTWCPSCRSELRVLVKEYSLIKEENIGLLAVNVGEPKYRISNYVEGKNIKFPVLLDKDKRVALSYDLIGVPTFVLIDKEGIIRFNDHYLPDNYTEILNPK